MHTVLILSGGRRVDALLLSASADRLRVVMPGRGDTVEFFLVEGRWTSDQGARMEIGALIAVDGVKVAHFLPRTEVRTFSASDVN